MDVKENMESSSPTPPVQKTSSKEDRTKDMGVILLNIFLAVVTVLLLGYIAYRNGYINLDNLLNIQGEESIYREDGEEEEESIYREDGFVTEEGDEPLVLEAYEGEFLFAIHPFRWEIVEYVNGEGSEMLDPGTSYSGLTGIQILHEDREIMKIEAVSGIGFIGCQELPRFEDSSEEYEAMQEALNEEVQTDELVYLDFTDTPYSEFDFLGERIRRIGTALYYDTVEDDEYFQPQCEVSFLNLGELGFEDADGYIGNTYMYTISLDATEEELRILDQILISMINL